MTDPIHARPGTTSSVDPVGDLEATAASLDDKAAVQIVAEEFTVSKRAVEAGSVRISTETHTREETVETTLDRADVDVRRVAINRAIDAAPPVRQEGETMIVPVVEERLVVTKQLYLVEELHILQRLTQETVSTSVPLRRQHAVIERVDQDGTSRPPESTVPAVHGSSRT